MNREGLRDMYRSLDVFVLASHREGLALVGIEAMACGVPVVSTRCGGPEDYIKDGVTGYLSDPQPESFADHISGLLHDPKPTIKFQQHAERWPLRIFARRCLNSTWIMPGRQLGVRVTAVNGGQP